MTDRRGPLDGIRILDLSRVLAGPFCTQVLADLGAEVIKVERPGVGDETRTWGPPYVKDPDGADTTESAYYLCANCNKRSVTVDFSQPGGAALVKRLLAHCDALVENFKVGGLAKFGLGYGQLRGEFPGLVYCSVTGFGQTGPYAHQPGYDMMAQGMGGLISITGEPDRPPCKVPVAINDIMTGMYAAVALLSALRHRDLTGEGQHVDLGLLDVQVTARSVKHTWQTNPTALRAEVGGKVICYTGDGEYGEEMALAARGADLLVAECYPACVTDFRIRGAFVVIDADLVDVPEGSAAIAATGRDFEEVKGDMSYFRGATER